MHYPLSPLLHINTNTPFHPYTTSTNMEDQRGDVKPDKPPPSDNRRGTKRTTASVATVVSISSPCGACKLLRRKCVSGCIFAPYFGSDQGAARFAAVHKVFGASNVSKLLLNIPAHQRHDAVVTISYEAQARLSDPVYGCVSTILALQRQVASLQTELSILQNQLINSRLAMATALQNLQQKQQQQQLQHFAVLQPAYSNNSSASNNLVNMSNFPSSFDLTAETAATCHSFKPLQLSIPPEDEDSCNPLIFEDQIP